MPRSEFGHVWLLTTLIYLLKLLYGILAWLVVVWPETFLFCPLYVFIDFSAAFCTAYCALDLARDQALNLSIIVIIKNKVCCTAWHNPLHPTTCVQLTTATALGFSMSHV